MNKKVLLIVIVLVAIVWYFIGVYPIEDKNCPFPMMGIKCHNTVIHQIEERWNGY